MPELRVAKVRSPLDSSMFEESNPERVIVYGGLDDDEYRRVATYMEAVTAGELWVTHSTNNDRPVADLDFLQYFPHLQRFSAMRLERSLTSISGLRFLPHTLESLQLGPTLGTTHLRELARFHQLRWLHLEGHSNGIETLSLLPSIEAISLRSIKGTDFAFLKDMPALSSLQIKLGGAKSIDVLGDLTSLDYLELWMIRGLENLDGLAQLRNLEYLFLQSLPRLSSIPSLARSVRLKRVWLESLQRLRSIAPILDAPDLQQVLIRDLPSIGVEEISFLNKHSNLEHAIVHPYSTVRADNSVQEILNVTPGGNWAKPAFAQSN